MNAISKLIQKYRTGNYSEQELNDLIGLMQLPLDELELDLSMYAHWHETDNDAVGDEERFRQILAEIHHNINRQSAKTLKPSWHKRLYIGFSKVAAVVLIPLLIAFYLFASYHKADNLAALQNTVTVPLGASSEFDLPDGTHIWLNAGSKLTYPLSFANKTSRVVALNGEGFFKVRKNKECPFVVKLNGMDVKVTGTTFNARAYSDESNITVALVEGSVQLGTLAADNSFEKNADLHPMEVAEFDKATKNLGLSPKTDLTKYTAWTQGITVFDNDPIMQVTAKLAKLYNVRVLIPDKELLQYRLTATFVNEPLERALKIISLSSPIDYKIITGKQNANGSYGQRTLILKRTKK